MPFRLTVRSVVPTILRVKQDKELVNRLVIGLFSFFPGQFDRAEIIWFADCRLLLCQVSSRVLLKLLLTFLTAKAIQLTFIICCVADAGC